MTTTNTDYAFRARLEMPYEQALQKVTAALKAEGFGVLTEIDMKDTLKQKLNVEFRKYAILGACNPPLADRALNANPDAGLLLPCNVVVSEEGDGSVVSIVDPVAMLSIVPDPALRPIASEARERLQRVIAAVGH